MSKRLLQRGRYPKSPGIDQYSNPSAQFVQTTFAQAPVTSEVPPYFNPAQSQPTQNTWSHPSYPNPSIYHENQTPSVSESNAYWSTGQVQAQSNDSWSQPAENYPQNSQYFDYQQHQQHPNNQQQQSNYLQQQQEQSSYSQQQQSVNYVQQHESSYVQQQPNYMQQQQQSNLIQQPQPHYVQQQQSNYLQQNQQPVGSSVDTWQQNPNPQVENQTLVPQTATYGSASQQGYDMLSTQQSQSINNNSSNSLADTSLISWENGSLNVTEPAQLPWTYGAPQYSSSTTNFSYDLPSSTAPSNTVQNLVSSSVSASFENSNPLPSDCNFSDSIMNNLEKVESSKSQSYTLEESKDVASNSVLSSENSCIHKDLSVDAENSTSSLSAFFQNSGPNTSTNSECGEISTPEIKNLDSVSIEESLSQLQINESERNSIAPTDDEQEDHNLDDTDDGGNQEVNFIQEGRDQVEKNVLYNEQNSTAGFSEEPVNQEVPEPSVHLPANLPLQPPLNQDNPEMLTEEPLNQQIPIESGKKSRSASRESDRIVIRPREESPFKPPRPNGNLKGTVVQQEMLVKNVKENKSTEKTVVQEVNLETFPDNLERPPDYEELRKQSSFYASHQKHLRTELNSSPSSLLCDNPDIPCVTLAPAAPPIHSSAKSDKSESSSDSKREMASFNESLPNLQNLVKEPVRSASSRLDSEFHDQSLKMTKSSSVRDFSEDMSTHSLNSIPFNSSTNSVVKEQNNHHPSQTYLKDSQIKEVRNPESYRKPVSDTDNLQNPNVPPSYYSDYPSKVRSTDSRYPPEISRQKFADKKYPSFDERQYYPPRGGSRPPSRSSLDERSEDYRYFPRSGDYYPAADGSQRGHPDYARPPSRMSESDASRPDRRSQHDYYKDPYSHQGQYPRSQDYYQRPPNYRGYDYGPYQRDPYYASYYDAYRYAYSNYNYGFYDELYRNDPRYKQYTEEQYRQYYAKYGYEGDYDRSSAHSGRSSANELSKDISSIPYLEPDLDSNTSEISAYNIHQDYTYDDAPNSSLSAADHSSTPSQRLTPVKFSYPHPIACFSAGGLLITAVPSQLNLSLAASVKIQNMQMIMENEESFSELKNYQGPLIRGHTHKNDVIEFCNQKIKVLKTKEDVADRDSYILLWQLMILLLRQNGSVAGSDIAELLLKDHEILLPHAVPLRHNIETPQSEQSPADVNDSSSQSHAGDTSSPDEGIVVLHDKSSLNTSKTVDVDKVTRKFREFLLFGHKKDALEWAMKHGLWGHALFLASKMDLRTYANVMTRFANSLALNDPLQTLYQLMSGRQPSAVTCVADKKWGDWRPHLAMILSNPSALPDVDSRSITTLGDTLASSGCLPAAQFCYIMAQVDFGTFEQKNSKLVLLTGDHRLSFEEFATNEAIQCTEIYEYAQSLANPGYLLIHLQMYKFLYALRLVEHGFLEEALHYCEVIAGNLQTHSTLFSYDLISEVFKLASRLKYHDPHFLRGQGEFEDQDDPEWLKNLELLVKNYNNLMQMQNSEVKYEQPDMSQTINEQLSGTNDNVSFENTSASGIQADYSNSMNNVGYYQQNNWNQQTAALPNNVSFSNSNNQQELYSYHQGDMSNNQSSFQMENKVPSHEENETTSVPSSPLTQTSPFDYYSGSTQQEWNSVHSLPSVPLSDVGSCHLKSDLENLVKVEETESDVALCSSAHSTPLHNYLLSKDDSDDRQMLMNHSNNVNTNALNSCLKSKYSHSSKNKKCIKFDASVSGHQSRLQRTGIRRRKFSKKKNELTSQSDSSPEGSPSKEKNRSKLSILATLGIIRNDNSSKFTKRKRKAKKKNETIEKLLQSKKTFAIDEPCEPVNVKEENVVTESCQETKKIIGILKKMSDDDKRNSELSQLMANEFNKKPPLIFGGTYPIDEPFESKRNHQLFKSLKKTCPDESVSDIPMPNTDSVKKSNQVEKCQKQLRHSDAKSESKVESCVDTFSKIQHSENIFAEMSPLRMFKKMQMAAKREMSNKEKKEKSVCSSRTSNSNSLKSSKNVNNLSISENKYSGFDQVNSYNSSSTRRERRDSALSSSSRYSAGNLSASRKPPVKETPKPETKPESKPSSQAGKTWLGGIFSRLLPKAPNQMILPDDKNPTIVWDEVQKRWVNKDSNDEDETNAPLAPPTDMELMGSKSSDIPVVPLTSSVPPAATSSVNKFQRPKTRAMRQNYVDILNNSGATTKTNIPPEALFPAPLEQTATTSNMFIPQSAPSMGGNSSELENSNPSFSNFGVEQQEQAQAVPSTPLMFDPAEFESRKSNFSNQRHMIGQRGRRTYPT